MFIHCSRLTYRLQRIATLLDRDLSDADTRVNLHVATRARVPPRRYARARHDARDARRRSPRKGSSWPLQRASVDEISHDVSPDLPPTERDAAYGIRSARRYRQALEPCLPGRHAHSAVSALPS
ncbi:MAG: helix-turn-helix domain-containing protein [Acidimicrobiia bacterium]